MTTKRVARHNARAKGKGLDMLAAMLPRVGKPTKAKAATAAEPIPTTVASPAAEPAPPVRRRRRRRRSKANVLAVRTIADIKRKERQFVREVSAILTDALGFPVRVSRVKVAQPMTPRMNKFARMPRREARRQVAEAFAPLNDPVADI